MNTSMIITFLILFITTILFVIGKLRSDFVALLSLLALSISGIITEKEALSGFSSSLVIMIAGLFIVGEGIFKTGLASSIGNRLIRMAKNSEIKLLVIVILVVGAFSAFMSNTGTVAVLLPVIVAMARGMKKSPSLFLIPLAYASSLGGVMTLIGTPPNLVVSETLKEYGFKPFTFFTFTPIGIVLLLVGLLFMITIGRRLLPQHEFSDEKEEVEWASPLYKNLLILETKPGSLLIGQTLKEAKIGETYGIHVLEIQRKDERIKILPEKNVSSSRETVLKEDDVLLVFGKKDNIEIFALNNKLTILDKKTRLEKMFVSKTHGLVQAIISPESSYRGKSITQIAFREKYRCNVLAIVKNQRTIIESIKNRALDSGDNLIIHGEWDHIKRLGREGHLILLTDIDETESVARAKGKAPIATGIILFLLLSLTFEWLSPAITVLVSAFLMIISGCIKGMEDAYKSIHWESVILIAAMLPMSIALEKTGGADYISNMITSSLAPFGSIGILAGFYIATAVLSQFISNTATAVIFAPIAIKAAEVMHVSPYPFLVCVAIAASMAFATPVGSPTNAMVMSAGGYRFLDYVKIGVPLQIVLGVITILLLPLFFPF